MSELEQTQTGIEEPQTDVDVSTDAETTQSTETTPETNKPSRWEESARSQGWVPLEEWQGDADEWTDAKEFVKRGELFGKISHQSSEIKELRKAITGLVDHHQKVKETEFNRALDYLKQQKKAALEEGDADKLLAVDDAIDVLKTEKQTEAAKQPAKPADVSPKFVEWTQQNPWYMKDPELRQFADDVGVGMFQRNGGQMDEAELYNLVAQRVKKAYPEKFRGQAPKTPTVEGTGTQSRASKVDTFRLTEDEERVMKTFVRTGVMTKEEYIKELRRVKGL